MDASNRNSSPFPFTRDQAVREMVELVTDQPCADAADAWKLLSTLTITEDAMRLFGWLGLSTLVGLARRGCRKSAEALLNHAIGLPDKPFREAVKSLDARQTAQQLLERLLELGVEERQARALVADKARAALAAEGATDDGRG